MTPSPGDCWYDPGESSQYRVMTRHSVVFLEPHPDGGWLTLRVFETGLVQLFHFTDDWLAIVYSTSVRYNGLRRIA